MIQLVAYCTCAMWEVAKGISPLICNLVNHNIVHFKKLTKSNLLDLYFIEQDNWGSGLMEQDFKEAIGN